MQPSDSSALPLDPMQEGIEKAAHKLAGRPRHSAVNAIRGLKRAWLIAALDPEIALFRAITAEEEAATALIIALRQRRYPGAQKLNPKDHSHKAGWSTLIAMLGSLLAKSGWPKPTVRLDFESKRPRIDIRFPAGELGLQDGYYVSPDEPLNVTIRQGVVGGSDDITLFEEELSNIAVGSGAESIRDHIAQEANFRNTLLYASDAGITVVDHPQSFIMERKRRVFVLIGLTIILLQSQKHQLLAVQAVQSYLKALDITHDDPVVYEPEQEPPPFFIQIESGPDQSPIATIHKRVSG